MSLLSKLIELNKKETHKKYFNLVINSCFVGYIDEKLQPSLCDGLFVFNYDKQIVSFDFKLEDKELAAQRIERFFKQYFKQQQLSVWRDEKYLVAEKYGDKPLLLIERSILSFLGLKGYGVHVNGYLYDNNELLMWVAKRSALKPTYPSQLDQIAAGGLPYGLSVFDNMIKECGEEATIPKKLALQAKSVSAITYHHDLKIGKRRDYIFCYDLALPKSFKPYVNDGEVESFELMPIQEILELIANTDKFKLNCCAVIIDFAMRHGYITPQNKDYLALKHYLYQL